MNMQVVSGRATVEHLHIRGDPPSPSVESVLASLHGALADARLDLLPPDRCRQLQGDVLLVSADAIGDAALVILNGLRKKTPVRMILLVPAVSAEQRILLLSLGIDHVLPTTVDVRELTAVLRNATRGTRSAGSHARAGERDHRWQLDDERWLLVAPNLREIRLTRAEYHILRALFDTPATVLRRCDLIAAMNGTAGRGGSRALDVQLSRLRHKVWACAQMELPLRSERNAGYLFAGIVDVPGGG